MRARGRGVAVVAVAAGLALCACGTGTAAQQPIPLSSAWHPGLLVDGYPPAGLGPSPTGSPTTSPSAGAAASSTASGSPSASASDTTLDDPTQRTLSTLLLQSSDVPTDLRVALDDKGASLSVPSLTYCRGNYASEAHREARRRVVVVTGTGASTDVVTEAVLYQTGADAAAAISELAAASAACPSPRTVTNGSSSLVFTVVPSTDIDASGFVPDADRVMASTTVTGSGSPYRLTRLWQRRGRVLVGLYYSGAPITSSTAPTFTTEDLSNVKVLGGLLAQRLDALDPAVVGTT